MKNKHPRGQRQTALHSTGVDPAAVFLALPQSVPSHKTSPPFRPHLLDPGRYERVQRAGFARAGVRRAASSFNHNGQDGDKLFLKILGLRFQGYRDPGAGRGGGDVKGILEKGLPGLLHQRRRRLAAVAGSQADACALIFLAEFALRILQELIRSRDDWNNPRIVSNKYKRHIFFAPMQYLINAISKSLVFPKSGWEGPQSRETELLQTR